MKKEKVVLNQDEALLKAFEVSLNCINEYDKLYMEHLSIKANHLESQIKSKYQDEPSKFFKRAHNRWQLELNKLEDELMDIYRKVEEELSRKEEFYKKLKEN